MTLTETFEAAQARVKSLPTTPPPDTLLALYSLYKQATLGDVTGPRPGLLDFKGRAKWDAWATQRGVARELAMERYVALVERLVGAA